MNRKKKKKKKNTTKLFSLNETAIKPKSCLLFKASNTLGAVFELETNVLGKKKKSIQIHMKSYKKKIQKANKNSNPYLNRTEVKITGKVWGYFALE